MLYKSDFGDTINTIPRKYPNKYITNLESTTIHSKIIKAFGIETLKDYIKDIYIKYINEYRKIIEDNFF